MLPIDVVSFEPPGPDSTKVFYMKVTSFICNDILDIMLAAACRLRDVMNSIVKGTLIP